MNPYLFNHELKQGIMLNQLICWIGAETGGVVLHLVDNQMLVWKNVSPDAILEQLRTTF